MPSPDVSVREQSSGSGSAGGAMSTGSRAKTSVSFRDRAGNAWFRFSDSPLGTFAIIYVLAVVPAVLAGVIAWNVTAPPVELGRATVVVAEVNGAEMVRFPDGSFAPARLESVVPGDSVTVFLNGSTVTNDPSSRSSVSLLWALLGGGVGLMLALLFLMGQSVASIDRRLRSVWG